MVDHPEPRAASSHAGRTCQRRANGFADAGSRPGADRGRPAAVQEVDRAERDEGRTAGARLLREAIGGPAAAGGPARQGDPQGCDHAPDLITPTTIPHFAEPTRPA